MEIWLHYLITKSLIWSFLAIFLVTFLESLALIGILLPGAILMASLGAAIGSGYISFYPACIVGTIGCLLGDWISYFIGFKLQKKIKNWTFLKKYQSVLDKISNMIHKHSVMSILVGRFFGHTRSLVPLVAGMMKLPFKKFLLPNIFACLLWPPFYFIPGIFAGIAIHENNLFFKIFFFLIILFLWIGIYFLFRCKNSIKNKKNPLSFLLHSINFWFGLIIIMLGLLGLIFIQFHPTMKLFCKIFWNIIIGSPLN